MAAPYSSSSSLTPSNLNLNNFSPALGEDSFNKVQKIIDMERYNGRINIMDQPDKDTRFKMYEKIAIKNKATEFRESLAGVQEDNLLGQVFFSEGNVQILQNGLRAGVYEMSNKKFVIPPQNIDQLKIVMRSTYLQYAEHNSESITKQIEKLNKIVLDWVIPTVYNEATGYMRYIQDQSTLVQPLEMPKIVDRDYKQLEWKRFF